MRARRSASSLRIVLLGYIVRCPLGGMAWHHLQYAMGFDMLGHDVYFVEDSDDYPSCYDPVRGFTDVDPSYGLRFAQEAFEKVGLGERWAYYDAHADRWHGPSSDRIVGVCRDADLLINLGGVNPLRPWTREIPARAYIDQEPALTQVRHLTNPEAFRTARQHTNFFSFGENIGRPGSTVPPDGLPWCPTRQPIALDAWPVTPGPTDGKFTTVMQWDSHPLRPYEGREYGMKSHSFAPYLDLPHRVGPIFELAVGGSTTPRQLLRENGWRLRNPLEPTRDPWTYRRYIQRSRGEFTVAKQAYVATWSGWFSERSAAYLASGRPVVTEETGFSDWLETQSGVLPFSTPEEAVAGVEEVGARYQVHCQGARAVAEEYFDGRKVLPPLLEAAMNGATAAPSAAGRAG
jgi:hypothetical protein